MLKELLDLRVVEKGYRGAYYAAVKPGGGSSCLGCCCCCSR